MASSPLLSPLSDSDTNKNGTFLAQANAVGTISAPPLMGWVAKRNGDLDQEACLISLTGCLLVAISLG